MKAVLRSPFAIGALLLAIAIIGIAIVSQPNSTPVETGRAVVEPDNASISDQPGADLAVATSDEDEIAEAPPALGLIDPTATNPRDLEGPELLEGGQTPSPGEETSDDLTDELWDDSAAGATTSTAAPALVPNTITTSTEGQTGQTTTTGGQTPSTSATTSSAADAQPQASESRAATTAPETTAAQRTTTTAAPTTTARPTTTPAPPTTTTTAPTTTTAAPAPKPAGTKGLAGYIAPSAPTYIPVYDTAWQMMVRSTPAQADNYFSALKANGFTGTWSGIIHHAPATYNLNFAGGGKVGNIENGELVLTDAYVAHARQILDSADRHGMKVGLVAAWQNLYLPGGGADSGVGTSDSVRGTITTANAYAYGRHIAEEFGDHPAVSMWVFGGDAGTNNTEANKAVWREMARGVRDAGNGLSITYHTPTSEFDQLNYAGESWLDFIAPETGHAQDAAATESELRAAKDVYGLPVWQGEPRYFNINFDWVNAAFRDPGVSEVQADAQAAENAGVSGYVYGDAGRWTWCAGYGDSSPCNANNVAASFGAGEAAVIDVFSE